jgi:hypothetical protein
MYSPCIRSERSLTWNRVRVSFLLKLRYRALAYIVRCLGLKRRECSLCRYCYGRLYLCRGSSGSWCIAMAYSDWLRCLVWSGTNTVRPWVLTKAVQRVQTVSKRMSWLYGMVWSSTWTTKDHMFLDGPVFTWKNEWGVGVSRLDIQGACWVTNSCSVRACQRLILAHYCPLHTQVRQVQMRVQQRCSFLFFCQCVCLDVVASRRRSRQQGNVTC